MIDRHLKITDVMEVTRLSRSTIKTWVKDGRFPAPVKIGTRLVRWPESVVAEWMKGNAQ